MFGTHSPDSEKQRTQQAVASVFTRGLQAPGKQWKFKFANGYGASVINDGYGADQGLYELAVLNSTGALTYETPITDDVLGYQTEDEITAALDAIAALPAAEVAR